MCLCDDSKLPPCRGCERDDGSHAFECPVFLRDAIVVHGDVSSTELARLVRENPGRRIVALGMLTFE